MDSSKIEEHITVRCSNGEDSFVVDMENEAKLPETSAAKKNSPWRSQFEKTQLCQWYKEGKCKKGSQCRFAHTRNELRERPDLFRTSLCPSYSLESACSMGDDCPYAHSEDELRSTRAFYKKNVCSLWLKGSCTRGDKCRYAHSNIHYDESLLKTSESLDFTYEAKSLNECKKILSSDSVPSPLPEASVVYELEKGKKCVNYSSQTNLATKLRQSHSDFAQDQNFTQNKSNDVDYSLPFKREPETLQRELLNPANPYTSFSPPPHNQSEPMHPPMRYTSSTQDYPMHCPHSLFIKTLFEGLMSFSEFLKSEFKSCPAGLTNDQKKFFEFMHQPIYYKMALLMHPALSHPAKFLPEIDIHTVQPHYYEE